jgi:isocitrate/isopropylmalate dehydrogenase
VGMMLDYLGFAREAADIEACVTAAIREDKTTSDLGGPLGTREVGDWICAHL